jgi:hypothetical protein
LDWRGFEVEAGALGQLPDVGRQLGGAEPLATSGRGC